MSELAIGLFIGLGFALLVGFFLYKLILKVQSDRFELLAQKITQENSLNFKSQATSDLQSIISPLNEQVKEYKTYLDELHKYDLKDRENLRTTMTEMIGSATKIENEAKTLSQALSQDVKYQGDWGEIVLERVLELSGLTRDREYFTQTSFKDNEGNNLRPDIIIKLPNESHIVIDSKVSFKSYYNFVESKDEASLKELKKSVTSHIEALSKKDYSNLNKLTAPDFVYLFLPIEGVFSLVIKEFPELIELALKKNIILVSPLNLTANLKTVASLWRLERQSQNANLMAEKAGAMYDKLASLVSDIEKLGDSLTRSLNLKEEILKKLSTGRGSLISRSEELKELGAKTTKTIENQ